MQMDGTYGMTGGMSEMLIQSHAGQIELLPTLPDAWKNGSVKGIRARGNITVDMKWKDGKVTAYKLTTTTPNPQPVKLIVNGKEKSVTPEVVK
jgi:alpha-L-fucosidase 2